MASDDPTDEQLLAGSSDDFGEFYLRTEAAVLVYFVRRTRDAELAADLTAETFAQALASRGRFRPRRAPARAWLFGIAAHVLSRSMRRGGVEARGRRRLSMERIVIDDEQLARIDELADADLVALALAGLPGEQQAAVRARVLDEEDYPAIAARLSCSEAVVRQRVSRGLNHIRTIVQEEQP